MCSNMFYKNLFRAVSCQKLLLEEVYMLDRFAMEVFLSVYIDRKNAEV